MTNNDEITIDPDATYTFTVSDITVPNFKLASAISNWLVSNLEDLEDTNGHKIFSKVNTGFNENILKGFGVKPVCDVYINNVEYNDDFDYSQPIIVNTIILFYLKGANNHSYSKICELHDYLMQEFIENDSFKTLEGLVSNTFIRNSEVVTQSSSSKSWRIIGALELAHKIY